MTPHIEALKEEIAPVVIMPGDPLRAKMIAEKYLSDVKLVNKLRNIYAYTGTYQGKLVTIMASGMGMPSMGIYSYELYHFYDVEKIIRIGSCGAYTKDLNLYDVLLVNASYSDSNYAYVQNKDTSNIEYASNSLNNTLIASANKMNKHLTIANIYSSDVFYKENDNYEILYEKNGCLAVEMESFALFHNAKVLGKQAACLLTVSDNLVTKEETSPLERQNSFCDMIEIALNTL